VTSRVLLATVLASTLVRLAFSRIFFGFHGDEVELLEEAFRALGWLEATPWGLRNLLVPRLLVAPALWSASRLGIADTAHLLWIATWPFVILASLNLLLVHRLAERWADRRAADLAVVLYACHWIPLSFGATAYPRTLAVTCVLLATLALDGRDRDVSRGLGAGALIALAFAARYSEAIYLAPLACLAFAATRPRSGSPSAAARRWPSWRAIPASPLPCWPEAPGGSSATPATRSPAPSSIPPRARWSASRAWRP